jgi:hypothetical protein
LTTPGVGSTTVGVNGAATASQMQESSDGGDPAQFAVGAYDTGLTSSEQPGPNDVSPLANGVSGLAADGQSGPAVVSRGSANQSTLFARGADLLASCTPFSRESITRAFDRILEQLSDSDSGLLIISQRSVAISSITAAALAVAATVAVRRRLRSREGEEHECAEREDLSAFPILPSRRQRLALEEF